LLLFGKTKRGGKSEHLPILSAIGVYKIERLAPHLRGGRTRLRLKSFGEVLDFAPPMVGKIGRVAGNTRRE